MIRKALLVFLSHGAKLGGQQFPADKKEGGVLIFSRKALLFTNGYSKFTHYIGKSRPSRKAEAYIVPKIIQ